MITSSWENQIRSVIENQPELQTWANHLDIRMPEIRIVSRLAKVQDHERVLEIGCGNGLASAYFANQAHEVVASDLASIDHEAHSIGLERAQGFFNALQLKNVSVQGCSAESLPFPDASFDVIVSFYALEHIPDLPKALAECRRVLKKGGRFVAAVPASAWSATYPIAFYLDLISRVGRRAFAKFMPTRSVASASTRQEIVHRTPVIRDWKSFRKVYRNFPLPEPHGEYANFFQELLQQRPSKWKARCTAAGFSSVSVDPISVLPRGLMETLLGGLGWRMYRALETWEPKLCRSKMGILLAQFICLTARK